jgi:succinyl-CoA synthetase beta subunit
MYTNHKWRFGTRPQTRQSEDNAMNLHEFQAKTVLSAYGIQCPKGRVAVTADEAEAVAHDAATNRIFVKAQILAGSRAPAGGVREVGSPSEARAAAQALLGQRIVTEQTGAAGHVVHRVLVETGVPSAKELYLAMKADGASGTLALIGEARESAGIENRQTRQELSFDSAGRPQQGDVASFCRGLGLAGRTADRCAETIANMHRAFVDIDASLIEMSPLAVTASDDLVVLDAKVVLDDNALFRHRELAELRDKDEIDGVELEAQRHQINFVQMDGDIGIVGNGAGLGLATLDMVRDAGGRPANFMDIRTTAKSLDIAQGIGLVLDNPSAKVLLVNVYGGGMQPCDTIIEGLGIAVRRKGRVLPIVMRLTGNNEDLARLRLANFNLPVTECADMWQAVTQAVALARGRAR